MRFTACIFPRFVYFPPTTIFCRRSGRNCKTSHPLKMMAKPSRTAGVSGKSASNMKKTSPKKYGRYTIISGVLLAIGLAPASLKAQDLPAGDALRGQTYFQANCALCHSAQLGPDNTVTNKQGPSLVGVVGRRGRDRRPFQLLQGHETIGVTWDAPSLDRFLVNPIVGNAGDGHAHAGAGCGPSRTMSSRFCHPEDSGRRGAQRRNRDQ